MSENLIEERVVASELRRLFNEGRYYERVLSGELAERIRMDKPTKGTLHTPVGTRSQSVEYYDQEGQRVAVVHQYLLPDGTLGASGRPDPKMLLVGNVLYKIAIE
jgi:hypothetical protein